MSAPMHVAPRIAGKLVLPVMALVALYLAASGAALAGGLTLALATALHALLFGPAATQRAFPVVWLKVACALGVVALILAALAEQRALIAARVLAAAGVLLSAGGGLALAFLSLSGRAHALRDEDW